VSSLFSLEDKVAIVTGGGRWTGRTIALEMAKAGADVVVCARTVEGIEEAAAEIRGLGRRSLAVQTDVRVKKQVDNLVKRTLAEFGRVDILVNNAGGGSMEKALELNESGWDLLVRENLKPVFLCSKAVVGSMIKQGGGCIVNIASCEGVRAAPCNPAYGAAKAGVMNLTMTLAVDWAPYNIRVNAVAPGFIAIPGLQEFLPFYPHLVNIYNKVPLKRAAKFEEIAGPVIFLASAAAGYTTGITIIVDGGMTSSTG
jgi:NAD(P)-dependent dehydrogenase (short-subunit alcohol dehydrogenase family)